MKRRIREILTARFHCSLAQSDDIRFFETYTCDIGGIVDSASSGEENPRN